MDYGKDSMLTTKNKTEKIIELNKNHAKVFDNITIFNFYKNQLFDVKRQLKDEKDFIYLDAGCGTGNFLTLIKDAYIIGVDISKEMLLKAKTKLRRRNNCEVVLADIQHLPFKNSSLDAIVSINVLYQLPEPNKFIEESYRVLKVDGLFILSTPHSHASFKQFAYIVLDEILNNYDPKLFFKLLYKFPEFLYGLVINKRIIDINPNTFYERKTIKNMLRSFKIKEILKTYANQNWLVSAYKTSL